MNKYLRRISRFRMSTLLVLLTLVCIWLGARTYQARTQEAALERIRELRGTYECVIKSNAPVWLIDMVGDEYFQEVVQVKLKGHRIDDRSINFISSLPSIERLTIVGTRITDESMKHICQLANLEELTLTGQGVTDRALTELNALLNLRKLSLPHTKVTDDGLGALRKNDRLRWLGLSGTEIGDSGAEIIGSMEHLQYLFLDRTKVTDNGLKHLKNLSNLTSLFLTDSLSTPKGLQELGVSAAKARRVERQAAGRSDQLGFNGIFVFVFDDQNKVRLTIRWSSLKNRRAPVVRDADRASKPNPIGIAVPSIFQDEINQRLAQ